MVRRLPKRSSEGAPPEVLTSDDSSGRAIDLVRLQASTRGKDSLLKAMVRGFLGEVSAQIELLARAFQQGDALGAEIIAHRFKGNLGLLGARRARVLAEAAEEAARTGEKERGFAALALLEAELVRVREELRSLAE